ncbi:MAG: PIN domain nuclease [Acidobacteria bacterium]|nr:PIN domain nuclease [Acidobacteriota bacterium]
MNNNDVFLIDTSAWILVLRRDAPEKVKALVDQLLARDLAATTDVIFLELLAGSKTEKEFEELKQDLEAVLHFPIIQEFWIKAARLYFALRRKGITVPTIDVLIATIAIENGAGVVHADQHFDMLSQHTELKTRNLLQVV